MTYERSNDKRLSPKMASRLDTKKQCSLSPKLATTEMCWFTGLHIANIRKQPACVVGLRGTTKRCDYGKPLVISSQRRSNKFRNSSQSSHEDFFFNVSYFLILFFPTCCWYGVTTSKYMIDMYLKLVDSYRVFM